MLTSRLHPHQEQAAVTTAGARESEGARRSPSPAGAGAIEAAVEREEVHVHADIKELRASLSGLDRQIAAAREQEEALATSMAQGTRSKLVAQESKSRHVFY